MRVAVFLLVFAISLRYVGALNITFPSNPTAVQENTFNWTRGGNDPSVVWLRKQKLDDFAGATVWSGSPDEVPMLNLTKESGSGKLYFNRAGLFNVGVFYKEDYPVKNGYVVNPPKQLMIVTVNVNPTSAGAVPSTSIPSSTATFAVTATPGPSMLGDAGGHLTSSKVSTALAVGLTLGFATLIVIIAVTLLYFRYRRRRMADTTPIPFQGNRMMREAEADRESYLSYEKCDSPPPIQTIYSVPSDGSFSVTSPIAAAARDRERKRNKFLSFTTISSLSLSRSTTTVTRNSHLTDRTDMPLPPLPPRARTDRQMLIEQKIQLLQSKMIMLQSQRQSGSVLQRSPLGSIRPLPPLPPGSPGSSLFPTTPQSLSTTSGDVQVELEGLKKRVERMKALHESDWALGLTDVPPKGLHD